MKKRRSAQQWQEILAKQKKAGWADAQAAGELGVSVSSLRAWRQRLKSRIESRQALVEVSSLAVAGELRIHLPNGLIVEVPRGWPADNLAVVVSQLRGL